MRLILYFHTLFDNQRILLISVLKLYNLKIHLHEKPARKKQNGVISFYNLNNNKVLLTFILKIGLYPIFQSRDYNQKHRAVYNTKHILDSISNLNLPILFQIFIGVSIAYLKSFICTLNASNSYFAKILFMRPWPQSY